jgi:hypothetical protein
MATEMIHVSPSEIEIGERLRKDNLGDTSDLEKSIRKLGLLQPIGITGNKKLVWGWRRLETWKKVKGDEPIPAVIFPEETSRLAELAENLCRLDLPWHLKDTAITELHKQLEKQAESDFLSESDEKSFGRPPKAWTHEDTADVLGISRSKVSTSLELVKAMEVHPELRSVETEEKALETLKKLKEPLKPSEPKTFKCQACQDEYEETVTFTTFRLCPSCALDFDYWRIKKQTGEA